MLADSFARQSPAMGAVGETACVKRSIFGAVDKNLSRLLHDRYLSRINRANVPALIKGRQVGKTLLALQSFAAMGPLLGKKHDAGLLVANKS